MQIVVNGVDKKCNSNTIQGLIDELGIGSKVMAAALNMEVVKKENWETQTLSEGDKIEFLEFVGGG